MPHSFAAVVSACTDINNSGKDHVNDDEYKSPPNKLHNCAEFNHFSFPCCDISHTMRGVCLTLYSHTPLFLPLLLLVLPLACYEKSETAGLRIPHLK